MGPSGKVLLVDLNNFARYPSISIGYLAATLRQAGLQVEVFAPLMVGVAGVTRERRPHRLSLLAAKINHRVATSPHHRVRSLRNRLAKRRLSEITAQTATVLAGFRAALDRSRPEAVLISTYLMYRDVCAAICASCRAQGIPVMIGGPYFAQQSVVESWVELPGLTAVAAGELELDLPAILRSLMAGEDASRYAGVITVDATGRLRGAIAPPLHRIDAVPHPDYSDFPWALYPNRIAPVITGRGCGWGVCSFCSDVQSTAGRSFRSRDPADVLSELSNHHRRYDVSRFVFTDLKLNSNVEMWRTLSRQIQHVVPGAKWIGAVHVGVERDNGLSAGDLRAAADSGCVRLTTGLETGSQRLANVMRKGTRVSDISRFLHQASDAGISCRCTMILGHPGETAEDVILSAEFLERHVAVIERVALNRLQVIAGTRLHDLMQRTPPRFKGVQILAEDATAAQIDHRYHEVERREHRKAVMRLLAAVHTINVKPLAHRAREFEGVM